jgi:DNA polymerase beta
MNKLIIDNFNRLIKQIMIDIDMATGKSQLTSMYRLKSIRNTLKIIKQFPTEITSSDQLKNTKNIGIGSLRRIDEILKTGKLKEVVITKRDEKYLKMTEQLESVFGIGKKKSYDLIKNHNITSISKLKKLVRENKIKLSEQILKGLKYYNMIKEDIPREEIDNINIVLKKIFNLIDKKIIYTICGSYRREKDFSNDIDILIVHPQDKISLDVIIYELKKYKLLIESLNSDDVNTKYMGLLQLNKNYPIRRIDIRLMPHISYYPALLYFTGSKDFNTMIRLVALNMDYTLNEYGLYDINHKRIKIKSEKDIFKKLGLEYISPNKR